jgi:hypothetical protein
LGWNCPREKGAKYFLVEYYYLLNKVLATPYKGEESQRANLEYIEAEKTYLVTQRNIVLVSVDSIQALERAYPNYFLDTEQFTALLARTLQK